jgi:predicted permease
LGAEFDSDFILTALTTLALMGLGLLCLGSMFYYKYASAKPTWNVHAYQIAMNTLASPLVIVLCLLLVVCVPKRMLPGRWLLVSAAVLLVATTIIWLIEDLLPAIMVILTVSIGFQLVTLGLLLAGKRMRFRKSGFLMQLGSILIHAGFVFFIMDFALLHDDARWHLPAFWAATFGISAGCLLSFWGPAFFSSPRSPS